MKVYEKAQAVMTGNAPLVALVPAIQIRVPGDWQNVPAPFIFHGPSGVLPEHTYERMMKFRRYLSYQVEIYAATYSQAGNIYHAVVAALDGKHGEFRFDLAPGQAYTGRDDKKNLEFWVAAFAASGQES